MTAKVDDDKCIGCRICVGECPEGMEMDGRLAKVKDEAAESCPRNAIIIGNNSNPEENQDLSSGGPGTNLGGRGKGRGLRNGSNRGNGKGRSKGRRR